MTDDELKLARKLVDAASPGPWTVNEGGIIGSACPVIFGVLVGNDPNPYTYVCTDDSNFICASRTLVPALLDEIDRLRAERDAMRAVLGAAQTAIYDAMHAGHLSREYSGSVIVKIERAIGAAP